MSATTTSLFAAFAAASLSLSACAVEATDDSASCEAGGKCDGADQSCSDPHYGDGVCQVELSCAVPDIDCFTTFANDASAATWFAAWENDAAQVEHRAERALIGDADPRFQRVRALLDRGWEAFREHRPVGQLADMRPALVVVDDPTSNAFVIPDAATGKSAFAVMVHTGVLANTSLTDDANLGLMMHELQHSVGLHLIGPGPARLRRFYIAPTGTEPIGKLQPDEPRARMYGDAWLAAATDVGPFDQAELGGLPISGSLRKVFLHAYVEAHALNPTACMPAAQAYNALTTDIGSRIDPLDSSLTNLPPDINDQVSSTLSGLRAGCFASYTKSFTQVVAELFGVPVQDIEATLSPEDKALVLNKPFFDAMIAVNTNRRTTMRAARDGFEAATKRPWSALRYFSFEEDADDVTVPTLRAAGFDPLGQGQFLFSLVPSAVQPRCSALLDQGQAPPYGADYSDAHHATCWRIHHISQLATPRGPQQQAARTVPASSTRLPEVKVPRPIPVPKTPSETVIY